MIQKQTYEYQARVAAIHTLRVNVKTLAAEARIIRQETERAGAVYRPHLTEHRRGRLRREARYAHLALAFLRGRPYRAVEAKCREPVDEARLANKIQRHGPNVMGRLGPWLRGES